MVEVASLSLFEKDRMHYSMFDVGRSSVSFLIKLAVFLASGAAYMKLVACHLKLTICHSSFDTCPPLEDSLLDKLRKAKVSYSI
jgi:hypothetical protein